MPQTISKQLLLDAFSDPYLGPYEGEDFHIETDGTIYIVDKNIPLAATIIRKVNTSGLFENSLVKLRNSGDDIILGFDDLANLEPVYSAQIGLSTSAEIRTKDNARFYVYFAGKRNQREFKKLSQAKSFVNKTDKYLKGTVVVADSSDEWLVEETED